MGNSSTAAHSVTSHADAADVDLSVLIPIYNEIDNLDPLHEELDRVLRPTGLRYELILVDDGSRDGSRNRLKAIQAADPEHVRVALLRRNCGQTAALSAALDLARGAILVPMDGDMQNDPADIPRLLAKIQEGYDVVSGWRKDRKDRLLTRRIPSQMANRLVARISGVELHDFGCTMKAYRRKVLEGVRGRTFNVVLDLLLIRFFQRYAQRPIHLFGRIGLVSLSLSTLCFMLMLFFKYLYQPPKSFVETPLPMLVVMFFLAGIQSILMGLLAEMVMRTYYESQSKTTYLLGELREGVPPSTEKGRPTLTQQAK